MSDGDSPAELEDDRIMRRAEVHHALKRKFQGELENHLSTWGANCGAAFTTYAGHLHVLLAASIGLSLEEISAAIRAALAVESGKRRR